MVQITHYTSANYTDHPQVNIHWIHCIEHFLIVQDFWATCACPENQSVPWIHCTECICFIIQGFWATLRLYCKTEFVLKFFPVMRYILSFRIFEQLVLALKNRVCPKNFQATGGGRPPPPRTPIWLWCMYLSLDLNAFALPTIMSNLHYTPRNVSVRSHQVIYFVTTFRALIKKKHKIIT